MKIRVKSTIAACECTWFINTLTADSAMSHAHRHSHNIHGGDTIIIDETNDAVQEAHE